MAVNAVVNRDNGGDDSIVLVGTAVYAMAFLAQGSDVDGACCRGYGCVCRDRRALLEVCDEYDRPGYECREAQECESTV